jgi:Flp pilus assembly pilin Flp
VNLLRRYLRSEDGASAAEYAMILGALGAVVAVALFALGGSISRAFTNASGVVGQVASTSGEAQPVSATDPVPGVVESPTTPTSTPPTNNGANGNHQCGGNNGNGKGNNCTN